MSQKPKSNADFIVRANEIHGFKYDYSKTEYTGRRHHITITCPEHGDFQQRADSHLNGCGCPTCSFESMSFSRRKSREIVIQEMNDKHNGTYDYSKVEYECGTSKIEIICRIHGSFWMEPSKHLQGHGCTECANLLKSDRMMYSTEEFIELATKIHDGKYNYSETEYRGYDQHVIVICPKHGRFKQRANNHLSGLGCKKCAPTVSKQETKWLDLLNIPQSYRQSDIKIADKKYRVDAYDPQTNTIYEFYGDYWHGNPNHPKQKPTGINEIAKKTFGQLYQETVNRETHFLNAGYNLITIWESDWKLLIRKHE